MHYNQSQSPSSACSAGFWYNSDSNNVKNKDKNRKTRIKVTIKKIKVFKIRIVLNQFKCVMIYQNVHVVMHIIEDLRIWHDELCSPIQKEELDNAIRFVEWDVPITMRMSNIYC